MKNKSNFQFISFSVILLLLLIITYSNHFNNGFYFDDMHTVVNNVHIRSINNIPNFFVDNSMHSSSPFHKGLRPVVTSSLAIDYWLGNGLNPFYFHLSTFLIFIGLLVILYYLYKSILTKTLDIKFSSYIALFATAWFGIHTVNAETINYVIARSDVLSTFFILMSFLMYASMKSYRKYYLYIIPAILGVFSKETLFTLPILLFFYSALFEKEMTLVKVLKKDKLKQFLQIFIKLLPLIVVIIGVQLYTLSSIEGSSGFSNPVYSYLITQPYVWLHYFFSFFLPFNLSADTDWTVINNIFDDRVLVGFLFVIGLLYTIIKTSIKKKTRPIAFGLIWFIIALLPTSLVPLAEVLNDHRMFYAFTGLTLAVSYSLGLLVLGKREYLKKAVFKYGLVLMAFGVLCSYAYGTYQRNKVWSSGESLWLDVTLKSPKNGRGLMNYGLSQMSKGNYEVAKQYFDKAMVYRPNYSSLFVNLGVVNNAMNNPKEAEVNFLKAIDVNGSSDSPYSFYANFLKKQNRLIEAQKHAEMAHKISGANMSNNYVLMEIYNELKLWDKSIVLANFCLKIAPNDSKTINLLSRAQNKQNKTSDLILKVESTPTPSNYLDLSLHYYNIKEYEQCIMYSKKAIELDSNYYFAYNNICSSYNALGNYEEAILNCEKALTIKSDYQLAKNNLAFAIKMRNKIK